MRRVDVRHALAAGGRTVAVGGRAFRSLIVVQVALSTMLVVAATLLLATLGNLRAQPLGFQAEGVLTITVDADGTGVEGERLADVQMEMLERLRALPGVSARPRDQPAARNEGGRQAVRHPRRRSHRQTMR